MHPVRSRGLAACLVAGLGLAAPPVQAATVWLCNLSDDLARIVCVADASDPLEPAAGPPAPGTAAVVNGTRFPLDPARPYVVELWSPATEVERVAELAQATICFRTPGCRAILVPPADLARADSRVAPRWQRPSAWVAVRR